MPYMFLNAKRIDIDQPMFTRLAALVRKARPQIDNMSILEAYQVKETGDYALVNNKVYVILKISGHRNPKFLSIGSGDLKAEVDALNPTFTGDQRIRIDQHLRIVGRDDVYSSC